MSKSFEKDKWPLILWKQGVAYMRKVLLNREGHLNSRHALRVISKYELTTYTPFTRNIHTIFTSQGFAICSLKEWSLSQTLGNRRYIYNIYIIYFTMYFQCISIMNICLMFLRSVHQQRRYSVFSGFIVDMHRICNKPTHWGYVQACANLSMSWT